MNFNSLSLLDKTVQITPKVMRILGALLEREVTRDDPEWAAAVASLTVSEKVKIMPSRRQHKENERDCRTIVPQLVSSKPHKVLTSTSYDRKNRGTLRKIRKSLPLWTRIKKVKSLNETWCKIVCPGRRTVRRVGEYKINTRDKKICPGSLTKMKRFLIRSRTWRIKFCPGSSDGCEENTELTQEMVQTPSQTLQQMTIPESRELTHTQTGTRARDRNCHN